MNISPKRLTGIVFLFLLELMINNSPENLSSNAYGWVSLLLHPPEWIASKNTDTVLSLFIIVVFGYLVWPLFVFLFDKAKSIFCKITWTWQKNEHYLGINAQKSPVGTSGDIMLYAPIEYRIRLFSLWGRNNSSSPITNIGGYLRSDKTNYQIPLLLDGMRPEETYGIPPRCDFYISALFPNSRPPMEGYTPEDFWRHFGEFTLVFTYDGHTYKKKYSKKKIQKYIDDQLKNIAQNMTPKDNPRVKKR